MFKVNVSLLICYGVYRLILRKLTFYQLNRVYLFAAIIFSACMPFITFRPGIQAQIGEVQYAVGIRPNGMEQWMQAGPNFNMLQVIAVLYWSGVIVMAVVFCVQLVSLLLLYIRTPKATLFGQSIKKMREDVRPFSFFKTIFVHPDSLTNEALYAVLEHESVHAKQWHSIDVMLGELKRIFCWFNPAAWLILSAIRENLEFIADRKVLRSVDTKTYQYALLSVHAAIIPGSLSNHFHLSHLKCRITMMNKRKTSDIHLLKYLLAVPLTASVMLLTAQTQATSQEQKAYIPSISAERVYTEEIKPHTALKEEIVSSETSETAQAATSKNAGRSAVAAHNTQSDPTPEKILAFNAASSKDDLAGAPVAQSRTGESTVSNNDDNQGTKLHYKRIDRENVLFYIDGKRTDKALDQLKADDIADLVVLKGDNAQRFDPSIGSGKSIISVTTKEAAKKAVSNEVSTENAK